MEDIIYFKGNKKNNKIIAYFIYLVNDLFYLIFIIPLFSLWYYLIFILNDREIGSWLFLLIVFVFIYGYIKRKKLHKYYIPIIKIYSHGKIELTGFRGFTPLHKVYNLSDYKFYFLTESNLRTSSNCVVFEIENQIIYCWNDSEALYEILHEKFPQVELPKKSIFSIL